MIGRLIITGLGFAYGVFNLIPYTINAAIDGQLFKRPTKKDKEELAIAQEKYWNLGGRPFGCTHAFFTLPDGQKLHYVFRAAKSRSTNLVIFIHGFPDSYVLWGKFLENQHFAESANLVALDLPGYGGSDELPRHSGGRVLEAVSRFIMAMREEYHGRDGKVVVVGHDWGAIVSLRLAAEAPQLADRFVTASASNPSLMASNFKDWTSSARLMLHTFFTSSPRISLLRSAASTVVPIFRQLALSNYVFSFNLPAPLAGYVGSMGNRWLLRVMHGLNPGPSKKRVFLTGPTAALAMACSVGPSQRECDDSVTLDGSKYPSAVRRRISDAGWMSKLRLYRENAMFGRWEKSLELLAALSDLPGPAPATSSPALEASRRKSAFEMAPPGACRAPVTALFGTADVALEVKMSTNGLGEFLAPQSQVVHMVGAGHWIPVEKEAGEIFGAAVLWALKGSFEGVPLARALDGVDSQGKEKDGDRWRITVDQ